MAASERFSLLVESQTRGTAELQKLEDALRRVTDVAEKSAKKTTDAASTQANQLKSSLGTIREAIQNPLQAAGGAVDDFALKFGKVGVIAAASTAGLAAAGIAAFNLANSVQNLAEQQTNAAQTLGLTIKDYGLFSQAAKNAGLDADGLLNTIKGLSKVLSENSDEGKKGKRALADIGVSATDAFGAIKPTKDLLLDIADALGKIPSPAQRADAATKILGREGVRLLPVLNSELRDNIALLERMGVGFDDISAAKANKFGDKIDEISTKLDVLKRRAGLAVIALVELFDPNATKTQKQRDKDLNDAATEGESFRRLNEAKRGGAVMFLSREQLLGARPSGPGAGLAQEQLDSTLQRDADKIIARLLNEKDDQARLAKVRKDIDDAVRDHDVAGVIRLQAREKALEAGIKAAEEAKQKSKEFEKKKEELNELITKQFQLSTVGKGVLAQRGGDSNKESENFGDLASADVDLGLRQLALGRVGTREQDSIFGRGTDQVTGLLETRKNAAEDLKTTNEKARRVIEQEVELQTRKIELLTGPGGEVASIEKIAAIRIAALEKQKKLGGDIFELDLERSRIIQEKELRILDLKKQQREETRRAGESLFDAALAGGGGIRDFLKSQALVPARKVAGNLAVELFGGSSGKFQLPGLKNADGTANLAGRLLNGTPLGIDPLKNATDLNTLATQQNTAALLGKASGAVAGLGGISGTVSQALGIPGLFGGAGTNGIFTNLPGRTSADLALQNASMVTGIPMAPTRTGLSATARGVGYAGAIAGGAFGAYSGFKAGGLQGALTGTASLAGAAGSILALSGATGPAAPILAGVGIALGVVSSLLGNPKEKRSKEISGFLDSRAYSEPAPVDVFTDTKGRDLYYDMRGDLKSSPKVVNYVTNNISAIDPQSFGEYLERNTGALDKGLNRLVQDGGGSSLPAVSQALGLS